MRKLHTAVQVIISLMVFIQCTFVEQEKTSILIQNATIIDGTGEDQFLGSVRIENGLIAAIAYTHNLVLVTRNVSDFESSDLPIKNPWLS